MPDDAAPPPNENGRHHVSALAIAILQQIQSKQLDPKTLSEPRRQLCVRHLLHQGEMTFYEMGAVLGVSERTIFRDKKKINQENALVDLVMDESEMALDLIHNAERAAARLRKAGKWKDSIDVQIKCIEQLQSMGFVKKVEQKLAVRGQFSLLEVLELDKRDAVEKTGRNVFDFTANNPGSLAEPSHPTD